MIAADGSVGISTINAELGYAWNRNTGLNQYELRVLAQANTTSGTAIAMSWFRGRSSYTPMYGTGYGDTGEEYENPQGWSYAYCYPYVSVGGGSGTKTYAWTKLSGGGTLTNNTLNQCQVSFGQRFGSGQTSGYLRCVITDGTGATLTIDNIPFTLTILQSGQV